MATTTIPTTHGHPRPTYIAAGVLAVTFAIGIGIAVNSAVDNTSQSAMDTPTRQVAEPVTTVGPTRVESQPLSGQRDIAWPGGSVAAAAVPQTVDQGSALLDGTAFDAAVATQVNPTNNLSILTDNNAFAQFIEEQELGGTRVSQPVDFVEAQTAAANRSTAWLSPESLVDGNFTAPAPEPSRTPVLTPRVGGQPY
jgi:hypothetical protein